MCRITKELSTTKFENAAMPPAALEIPTADFKNLSLGGPPKIAETPCTPVMNSKCSPNSVHKLHDAMIVEETKAAQPERNYEYKIGTLIREGCYGEIRHATQVNLAGNGETREVAMKSFDLQRVERAKSENPLREVEIQQLFDPKERHLVPILDIMESKRNLYIVLPLFTGGDLLDVIETSDHARLTIFQAKEMFFQVLKGMEKLHTAYGVAHRDLSIENVFFQREENIFAVADFGLSCQVRRNLRNGEFNPNVLKKTTNICGKEGYIAPELWELASFDEEDEAIASETIDLFAIDVWALGIILFMSLVGAAPMQRAVATDGYYHLLCVEKRLMDFVGSVDNLMTGEDEFDEEMVTKERREISLALDMISWILNPNPKLRPTVGELLQHEWFRGYN